MSRFIIQGFQFEGDDAVSMTFLDTEDDLRASGNIYRTQTINMTSKGPWWSSVEDLRGEVEELIADMLDVFANEPPFIPGAEDRVDEDDDCMGGRR